MKKSKPLYVSTCPYGLANRIKGLMSALRLDPEAKIYWPRAAWIDCDYRDLFKNDVSLGRIPENVAEICTWRLIVRPEDKIPVGFFHEPPEISDPVLSGQCIDGAYERIPGQVRQTYLEIISRLEPVKEISCLVDQIRPQFDEKTVSVHIRTWIENKRRRITFRLRNFFRIMDKMNDAVFFVCSDSKRCLEKVKRRYPNRIYTMPGPFIGSIKPKNKKQMQKTMAEMILLGKAKTMLVTRSCTFTELSWFYGGCRPSVIVVPPSSFTPFLIWFWDTFLEPLRKLKNRLMDAHRNRAFNE
jgi:hypothetical protein